MSKAKLAERSEDADHRTRVARRKRASTRAKLMEATMHLLVDHPDSGVAIEDVIQAAGVSRGTFYNYFKSTDDVLIAIGKELNNEMTEEILPIYDVLDEPWQRLAVGFRLFLTRAHMDRRWASFVTRVDSWSHGSAVARKITQDMKTGWKTGQFKCNSPETSADFIMGASARCILALKQGVDNPKQYIDAAVHMALASVGCNETLQKAGVDFSSEYLDDWIKGELDVPKPSWGSADRD